MAVLIDDANSIYELESSTSKGAISGHYTLGIWALQYNLIAVVLEIFKRSGLLLHENDPKISKRNGSLSWKRKIVHHDWIRASFYGLILIIY